MARSSSGATTSSSSGWKKNSDNGVILQMVKRWLFTSESVTEGHPDKVCDQISDAVLDDFLRQDPDSRVAVESMTTTGIVFVAGEVTSKGRVDVQKIVRDTIREIGYDKPDF